MRQMDGALKRTVRISRYQNEYLMCFLNGEVITTRLIEFALDITNLSTAQLESMYESMRHSGYDKTFLVTYGMEYEDEYGDQKIYERPHKRVYIDGLTAITVEVFNNQRSDWD